jgi:two-component system, OmpR family, KDP operon response regulator KdpE
VRVALRHGSLAQGAKTTVIQAGEVAIDLANHIVTRKGQDVKLSAAEFKLLAYLASNAGRVLTYRAILANVWGYTEVS